MNGEIGEWTFISVPSNVMCNLPKFKTPLFTLTLSQWFNLLVDMGFVIERVGEPRQTDATERNYPNVQGAQVVPYYLYIRIRKAC
ncbi:MAG: hypothetical protein A2161_20310 [Candidatus Schekmanbacteria bacterium RBG_13_48_7]|uniref:Methyltransferase type 11 domain-containing protein n=1 Tax=Candidatus Schekmanbacteria bacterium RBG_13_48_7 TaxID=1817878 RepID=A0A1F7RIG6_9BACT|nr:MAG: hypothetical protein A2161_20310 [Candidatus Schekmanbacteria bacterium RBG_13_48_7]